MSDLEDARKEAEQKHEKLVRKIQTETKTWEDRAFAEQNCALPQYHGVLRLIRGIVKAADELNRSHFDTLTQ